MKFCYKHDDVPKTEHFVVVQFASLFIPGDERSRSHPGHGYLEHTEQVAKYMSFDTKDEWESFIHHNVQKLGEFVAMRVIPADTTISVKVAIADDRRQQ